ncbi:MAG: alpha/beta hydrolase-fold protein, partial [Gemmataceae bacterium]
LHGFGQDEKYFVKAAPAIDRAIVEGRVPPVIVACPDGTTQNKPALLSKQSWFINSRLGRYEDFVVIDVWDFLNARFMLRPEREAHVLAGVSMGGASAFNLGIKHRDRFAVVAGMMPILNPWYADCHGDHFAPFDPDCQGDKPYRPLAKAGRIGPITIRSYSALRPLFGSRTEVETRGRTENPTEMLDLYDVRPGQLQMFIGYGSNDQFNGGAEAESFLYRAGLRGINAEVAVDPQGRHNRDTAKRLFVPFTKWLAPLLAPYAPAP